MQNKNTRSARSELHVTCGASTWRARENNRQRRLLNGPRWAHVPGASPSRCNRNACIRKYIHETSACPVR